MENINPSSLLKEIAKVLESSDSISQLDAADCLAMARVLGIISTTIATIALRRLDSENAAIKRVVCKKTGMNDNEFKEFAREVGTESVKIEKQIVEATEKIKDIIQNSSPGQASPEDIISEIKESLSNQKDALSFDESDLPKITTISKKNIVH